MKTVTFEIPDDVSVGYFMHYITTSCNYYHELEFDRAYDVGGQEHADYVADTCEKVVSIVNQKCFEVPEWDEYQTLLNMVKNTK